MFLFILTTALRTLWMHAFFFNSQHSNNYITRISHSLEKNAQILLSGLEYQANCPKGMQWFTKKSQ